METPDEKPPRPYRPSLGFILCLLVIIPGLGYLVLPRLASGQPTPKPTRAARDIRHLVSAIEEFRADYGYWPVSELTAVLTNQDFTFGTVGTGASCVITNGFGREANNSEIMRILRAKGSTDPLRRGVASAHPRNPRGTIYFSAPFRLGTNSPGIGPDFVFRDPWGNPYIITLDLNGDGRCDDCLYHVKGGVSVWSFGPDGQASASERPDVGVNKDNVVTFR